MSKINNRYVDLSSLDKYKNTQKIDWNISCANHRIINFQYGEKSGFFKLIDYNHKTKKIVIKYLDKLFNFSTSSLLKCNLHNILYDNKPQMKKQENKQPKSLFFSLYCHTNQINKKKYFGITTQSPLNRWANGRGYKNNSHFWYAICKYGWSNFTHEILHINLNEEEASKLERKYINEYCTCDQNYGYNIQPGGYNDCSGENNSLSKIVYQFDIYGILIKKWFCIKDAARYLGNENYASNISRACKNSNKYALGFLWSYERNIVFLYIKESKIYEFTLEGKFLNLYSSIKSIPSNYNKNKIRDCCNHLQKIHKNRIWLFDKDIPYKDIYIRMIKYHNKNDNDFVCQYSKDFKIINYYVSIKEASEINNFSYQGIYKCCVGEISISSGYIWRYIHKDIFFHSIIEPVMRELKEN